MRIRVDRDKCGGHALCSGVDPVLFPVDDDGYSTLLPFEVAPGDEQAVRDGVACCPELALIVEEG